MNVFKNALLVFALGLAATAAAGPSGYQLLRSAPLPGGKGWDYLTLDSQSRRLYVTHGDSVLVVDADSDSVVGQIGPFLGIHGVALAADLNRGYVSDGKDDAVDCFDLRTLKVTARIPSPGKPDAILFEPLTDRVFAFNGESDSATVIQAGDNVVLKSIDLGGGPEFAVADGKGHVFVNLEDKNEVLRIDASKLKITGRWSVAPGEGPSSLCMDAKQHRLFIGCRSKLAVVMDSENGKVLASWPIGAGVDASGFDPAMGLVFHSCGEGTLNVVHEDSPDAFSAPDDVVTQKSARTMALDLKTHQVSLLSADFGPRPLSTTAEPHPRAPILPGSVRLLVVGKP